MSEKLSTILSADTEKIEDDSFLVSETLKNPESFGKIMNKYSPRIRRYICRIAGSNTFEVDDLIQNVFIKVYKNLNGYDSSLAFSSWIYRIAHNEVIDHIRKAKIRPRTAASDEEDDYFHNIEDKTVDILEDLENVLVKEQIVGILQKMKDKHRVVLTLKYLEDKDYNEISDILKIPLGTVATLVHRAKNEFKELAEKDKLVKE